jgi:hypothetical protein
MFSKVLVSYWFPFSSRIIEKMIGSTSHHRLAIIFPPRWQSEIAAVRIKINSLGTTPRRFRSAGEFYHFSLRHTDSSYQRWGFLIRCWEHLQDSSRVVCPRAHCWNDEPAATAAGADRGTMPRFVGQPRKCWIRYLAR